MESRHPNTRWRAPWIIGAVLATTAVSGYFMGLHQVSSHLNRTQPASLAAPDPARLAVLTNRPVPVATPYLQQDRRADGPNAGWHSRLDRLVQPEPAAEPAAAARPADEAALAELRAARAARRAYDGAPPVIPHSVHPSSNAACLACHGPGLAVKDRVASRVSHPHFTECTQCHVPAAGPAPRPAAEELLAALAGNDFAGLAAAGPGARAWPQAPPTIPHATFLRGDCLSCHGPRGAHALRTPHPERVACSQCHVADAERDQHRLLRAGLPESGLSTVSAVAPASAVPAP